MVLLNFISLVIFPVKFWQRFARMWVCEIYWVFSNIYKVAVRASTGNTLFLAQIFNV